MHLRCKKHAVGSQQTLQVNGHHMSPIVAVIMSSTLHWIPAFGFYSRPCVVRNLQASHSMRHIPFVFDPSEIQRETKVSPGLHPGF